MGDLLRVAERRGLVTAVRTIDHTVTQGRGRQAQGNSAGAVKGGGVIRTSADKVSHGNGND